MLSIGTIVFIFNYSTDSGSNQFISFAFETFLISTSNKMFAGFPELSHIELILSGLLIKMSNAIIFPN